MARTKKDADSPILGDKAEKILQGAMQEFLVHGYAATSMDRVATAAGVSKATVYSHFQDKEGLFSALMQRLAQEKIFCLQLPEAKAEVMLRQLATTLLEQISKDDEFLGFLRLVIGESGRFPELAKAFISNFAKTGIERLSHGLAHHPDLHLPDPEATARVFIGSVVYFMLTQEILHGKEIIPMDRDRFIDNLIKLVLLSQVP